jgi:hypothetical protein
MIEGGYRLQSNHLTLVEAPRLPDCTSELMMNSAKAYITKERHKFFRDTERNADLIKMAITNYNQIRLIYL